MSGGKNSLNYSEQSRPSLCYRNHIMLIYHILTKCYKPKLNGGKMELSLKEAVHYNMETILPYPDCWRLLYVLCGTYTYA